jgi:GGDEF domain-containing protein
MSHTDGAGAFVLTQRLRDAVELHIREVLPPMDPQTGVSAGLVIYPDNEVENFEALIAAADKALYRAKGAGKGCLDASH